MYKKRTVSFFFLFLSVFNFAIAQSEQQKSEKKGKPTIRHQIEIGTIFRVGNENVITKNNFDNTNDKSSNFLIGKYTQHFSVRLTHSLAFKKGTSLGFCYGTDMYIQTHYAKALLPLMLSWQYDIPVKSKVKPMIIQRVGYAFYFRNRTHEPMMTYSGIEGGATIESLFGISIATKSKVEPTILLGYRFQHLKSTAIYHTNLSLATPYVSGLPSTITEVSNGFYHFVYVTVGIKI